MNWRATLGRRWSRPALLAVSTALALGSVIFGGLVGVLVGRPLEPLLSLIGRLLPVLGGILVLYMAGVLVFNETDAGVSKFPPDDVESVETQTARQIGATTAKELRLSAMALYRCERRGSEQTVKETLQEAAVRVIETRDGLNEGRARESVTAGTWTDDPVAAAFLSPELGYPLAERLRGALDPGRAYRRRVERTLDAIERSSPEVVR